MPAKIQERLASLALPKPARVYNLGHGFYYSTPWLSEIVAQKALGAGDPYLEAFKAFPLYRLADTLIPKGAPYPLPPRPKEPQYDDPTDTCVRRS